MALADYERDPNRVSVAFIKYYYNLLNAHPQDLYKVYSSDAVMKHSSYKDPYGIGQGESVKGSEEIKALWTKSPLGGAKVMVQSIQSSPSFEGSILVVAVGEMAPKSEARRGAADQPSYKFVQTFLLVPVAKKDVYDVYNDVLTFVPDVDYNYGGEDEEEESAETTPAPAAEATTAASETVPTPTPTTAAPGTSADAVPVEDSDKIVDLDEEEKEVADIEAGIHDAEVEGYANDVAEEIADLDIDDGASKPSAEISAEAAAAKPAAEVKPTKGMSWANTIASSGAKNFASTKIHAPATTPGHARKDSSPTSGGKKGTSGNGSGATKKVNGSGKKGGHGHHESGDLLEDDGFERVDSKKNSRQNSAYNKKGQTIYPIFIKGVDKDTSESRVAAAFESAFGPLDSCHIDRSTGYIDFVDSDAQRKALGQKTIRVGSSEIKIEPRMKKDAKKKKQGGRNGSGSGNGSASNGSASNGSGSNGSASAGKHHSGSGNSLTDDGFKRVGGKH